MNECNNYIIEYVCMPCQTIYCVYRVLFALPVVHIYRYILKTDKWVMASCADKHDFRGFLKMILMFDILQSHSWNHLVHAFVPNIFYPI